MKGVLECTYPKIMKNRTDMIRQGINKKVEERGKFDSGIFKALNKKKHN